MPTVNLCIIKALIKEIEKHPLLTGIVVLAIGYIAIGLLKIPQRIIEKMHNRKADKIKLLFLNHIVSNVKIEPFEVSPGIREIPIPPFELVIAIDRVKEVCPKNWWERIFYNSDKFRKLVCDKLVYAGRLTKNNDLYVLNIVNILDLIKFYEDKKHESKI